MTTSEDADADFDLLARIAEQSSVRADAVAIDAGDVQISYGALARRAAAMSKALLGAGSRAGDLVAVWVTDRATLVSVMLGVLRAGAVFVPLETDGPDERLRQRLARLQPTFLIYDGDRDGAVARFVRKVAPTCAILSIPDGDTARPDGGPVMADRSTDGPSYIYFTSGSTGQPKGVVGSISALARRIAWEIAAFDIKPGTRVSQLVTPTFDPWFRDVFVPLCAGGTLCIPPEGPARMEPERLLTWIRDARIELIHCVPTLLNALVSTPARIRRLPTLRAVLASGETMHVSLVVRWRRRLGPHVRLVNLYGATEATMAQFFHVVSVDDVRRGFIPVGRPLPGVSVRVIDASGQPCPRGQIGEILTGGSSLTLGYHRDAAATAEAFVRLDGDELYYRTGDLGVEFEPGNYRLIGRIDDEVKIRGVGVQPREVEDALIGYPLIASCAVVARPDRDGQPSLVVYVVPETEYPPAVPEMRAYLRQKLPSSCIPAAFVIMKVLPISANGKVDRSRLPVPGDLLVAAKVQAPPRNALEAALAAKWAAVLGVSAVGIHDDFFDHGGHSLSAMRLAAALIAADIGKLSVRDVFDHPTIAAQAALLLARSSDAGQMEPATDAWGSLVPELIAGAPTGIGPESPDRAAMAVSERGFGCPRVRSSLFGKRSCNLVMVFGRENERESFEHVAHLVEEFDPTIRAVTVRDAPDWEQNVPPRPTLIFSPALLRHCTGIKGRLRCGYPLAKSEEYRILERSGVPVPRWTTLEEGMAPDLSGFGEYVVRKPDYGAKGAEVRIVRRDRVRWKPVVTSAAGPSPRLLVQQFVYAGLWPVSYRVNTLFGRVLYCMVITGNKERPVLRGPTDFDGRDHDGQSVSIVSNARDSSAEFCMDGEIISFGEHAARAFPDLPMLGVDILKDANSGQLFVIEVNALGHNWNFTVEFRAALQLNIARQFDGLRKAAYVLAEETQRQADQDQGL